VVDAESALTAAQSDLTACEQDYETAQRSLAAVRSAYQSGLDRHVQHRLKEEDAERLIDHAAKARATLDKFRHEVVRHHVHRIERLILDALRQLLRKDDLVVDVSIDPETFAIRLRGGGWEDLPPEQLSAGERQLFAVALLWALAKASGQAAPTVIDTPLGRLDSKHRQRLVERYFGNAGEQVILLSTDEEIDAKLYARLEPWLSRSYTISYDPEARGSRVTPGYAFAEADEREAA
jgi:DNA sulfur modification protein DndD